MSKKSYILASMKFKFPSIKMPIWTRSKSGQNFYDLLAADKWCSTYNNMEIAQDHPILTPAILFVAKLFSQAEFKAYSNSTGKSFINSEVIKLIKNPNSYQTQSDFLESLLFTQIANGIGVIYKKRAGNTGTLNSMYVLDYNLIAWPSEVDQDNYLNRVASDRKMNKEIIYDESGDNIKIKLKDLMFFYDLPNAVDRNPFKAKSRIDGLKQTLYNTKDSLTAKNIILKTNGKELITGNKEGFPLTPQEKQDAERLFQASYGLSRTRKRGLITNANINHKSLHIALRDLGLDESVKVDGNLIYTALHIPKDILSLEAKKTTYNNFKESMVSYIQNEMQSTLDSFCSMLNKSLSDGDIEIKGSFEHLPIMQFILIERYKGVWERSNALLMSRQAGLPDEIALELVGMDTNIKLNEIKTTTNGETKNTTSKTQRKEKFLPSEEDKIRQLIEERIN